MIDFLFNPKGRVSKKGLVVFLVAMVALGFVSEYAVTVRLFPKAGLVFGLLGLVLLWAKFVVPAKRLHDANRSGCWVIIGAFVFIGAVISIGAAGLFSVTSWEQLKNGVEPDPEAIEAAIENGVAGPQMLIAQYGGLILSLLLLLLPASDGANNYGADPRDGDGLGFGS